MSITFCENLPEIYEYPSDEFNNNGNNGNNGNNKDNGSNSKEEPIATSGFKFSLFLQNKIKVINYFENNFNFCTCAC